MLKVIQFSLSGDKLLSTTSLHLLSGSCQSVRNCHNCHWFLQLEPVMDQWTVKYVMPSSHFKFSEIYLSLLCLKSLKQSSRSGKMDNSVLKSIYCCCRGPEFDSQHLPMAHKHDNTVPGNLMPSDLRGYQTFMQYI